MSALKFTFKAIASSLLRMSRLTPVLAALAALAPIANAQQNEQKVPPGYVLRPNAQGQNALVKHAKTYSQCLKNGKLLGYSDADSAQWCSTQWKP